MPNRVERAKFGDLYAQVSALLVDGRYRPGDRIGLKDLATRLNVSVTPLREVLSRLVGRGVITEQRSEGYYLARLDARDIADLYALHNALLDRALRTDLAMWPGDGADDIWATFHTIVARCGDTILADTHHYLEDRLKLVRRCDTQLFGDGQPESAALWRSLRTSDLQQARGQCRAFRDLRVAAAAELALAFGRGGA